MEALGWLVAYVLGFGLVQLLLYRYIRRDDASPDAASGAVDRSARRSVERPATRLDNGDARETGSEGGVRCPHCGTVNEYEQSFAYCEQCVRPLQ